MLTLGSRRIWLGAHCEQSSLYKVKGELVAKNVVPKDVFDDIKDRITVSPWLYQLPARRRRDGDL